MLFRCLAALALWLGLTAAAFADRVALVIGQSNYTAVGVERLNNPSRDANGVAAALRDLGFDVDQRVDLTFSQLNQALRMFSGRAQDAEIAVVYFAGHGVEVDGVNYLIPTDAGLTLVNRIRFDAIPADMAIEASSLASDLGLVILDACRNNPFTNQPSGRRSVGRGLTRTPTGFPNVLVAYAAAPGTIASDGDAGGNSPYARALIDVLRGERREIRLMFGAVRDSVLHSTRGAQTPHTEASLGGASIYLHPEAATRPAPPADPCAAAPARPGYRCTAWNGFPSYERIAVAQPAPVRSVQPSRPAPVQTRDPCAGMSSPGWECVPENGQPTWRRAAVAQPPVRQTPASVELRESTSPMQSTATEDALRRYACQTDSGAQGVSFAEKCWPLDTDKIERSDIPESIRREVTDVTPLASLTRLKKLDLRNTQVSDLVPLSGLTELRVLYLSFTQVRDLTPLSGLTRLEWLFLPYTQVSDIAPLSDLTKLQRLNLSGVEVSDLTPLSNLTEMRVLDLRNTQLEDLTPLFGLTGLQVLWLNNTRVSDLTPLSGLSGLQMLDLTNIPTRDVTPLFGLAELQRLYLPDMLSSDVTPLSGLTKLYFLQISDTLVVGGDDSPETRAAVAEAIRTWRPRGR